jgi:hypothetical protein
MYVIYHTHTDTEPLSGKSVRCCSISNIGNGRQASSECHTSQCVTTELFAFWKHILNCLKPECFNMCSMKHVLPCFKVASPKSDHIRGGNLYIYITFVYCPVAKSTILVILANHVSWSMLDLPSFYTFQRLFSSLSHISAPVRCPFDNSVFPRIALWNEHLHVVYCLVRIAIS